MSTLTTSWGLDTEGTPGEGHPHQRKSWNVPCTDAFGRPYTLRITADRTSGYSGVGFKAPTGEYAFVDVDHTSELVRALTEANNYIHEGSTSW